LSRQSSSTKEALVPSDDLLVSRIRNADEAAFNIVYDRYFQRVYTFSFARLRNHADAEEVVQETFISVFRSIDAYRGDASLISWIYGIARNTVNNQLRRRKTQEQRMEQARPELMRTSRSGLVGSPEDQLALQRSAEVVKDRLSSVADWQAEVFVLRHMENLSIGEIAKRMSRSHDSIRSSLYRVKRLVVEAVSAGSSFGNEKALDEGSDWWGPEHASAHIGGGNDAF
jgi:RNA polymerase sigma-70 factor (ECF subfamily)